MKIGIDISQLAHEGTGVARYMRNLVECLLSDRQNNDEYVFLYSSLRKPLPRKLRQQILATSSLRQYHIPPTLLELLWNTFHVIPLEQFVGDVDMFITSDWAEPPSRHAKKITIIHDLIVYKFPNTTTTKTTIDFEHATLSPNIRDIQLRRLGWVKKESSCVITDSYASKQDIIEILDIPEHLVHVVYPYISAPKIRQEDIDLVKRKYHITKPFMLSVGKLEPRKNIPRLIEAFVKSNVKNLDLKIVGPKGWGNDMPISLPPTVHMMGYLPDNELYALYSLAEFFMFPSLYEGFGYPLVEAMALGCPVATSNISSLYEIAHDVGMTFDPNSTPEMVQAIQKLHSSPHLRKKYSDAGKLKAKRFGSREYKTNLFKVFNMIK